MGLWKGISRRGLLTAGSGLLLGLPALDGAAQREQPDPEEGVTAPEDLMKEHGVLNRCLLIYEEGIRRLGRGQPLAPSVFHATADLVRRFVEQYHERNEERYIFPAFERAGRMVDLVTTLRTQHRAGRAVTARILRLSEGRSFRDARQRQQITAACRAFIRMYRPHEAREDTILFPALRTILTPRQVENLGERMEADEKSILGDEGFEKSVDQVAAIERRLGIYDLKQFTPRAYLSGPRTLRT